MATKRVLTLSGRYAEIRKLCQFVCSGAEQAGFAETDVFHIELACDEACTNVIEHAYEGEGVGLITIGYEVVGEDFVITVRDNGRRFAPEKVPQPSTTHSEPEKIADNLKVGGLGIHFMRRLMDEVRYEQSESTGNILIMRKKLPKVR